jgi:D-glycero-alpha-D-manno-heptose-7-phosphate kinase
MVSKRQLAEEAVHVEQKMIAERVGSQDQYACAFGGFRRFRFGKDGSVGTDPIPLPEQRRRRLQDSLLLVYTHRQRQAHDVLEEQLERTASGQIEADLHQLEKLVDDGISVLTGTGSLDEFGALLHKGWLIKRGLSSKIAPPWVDEAYERARAAGAVGGKLLGAGGGGFLLIFVSPENRQRVYAALGDMKIADFSFDNTGSQLIFYNPDHIGNR